jgi:epsilon-lactone hydrolase
MQKGRAEIKTPPLAGSDIAAVRAGLEKYLAPEVAASQKRYPVDIAEQEIAGVKTHVIMPKNGEADKSRVLINLHGGAFMECAYACAMLESIPIAAVGRYKVVTVDYREAPEHVFPAASEDIATVYAALLKTYKPEKVGIYGCSAGGALTGQVEAWFQDKGLPNPGALGIFGAGAVRFGVGDSAYVAAYIDGSFPAPRTNGESPVPTGYFKGADPNSALVSPGSHLDVLAKFPPTLIITGTRAADLSPAIYSHSQLLKAGARSNLLVGEGMGHCYINNSDLPEARDAYDVIVKFFNENLGAKR